VVVEIEIVFAAITFVDAALLQLARLLVFLRDLAAGTRRRLFDAAAQTLAVSVAGLDAPEVAVRNETNGLASGHASLALRGAFAHHASDAVAEPPIGTRNRRHFVDLSVAVVVDTVAHLFA